MIPHLPCFLIFFYKQINNKNSTEYKSKIIACKKHQSISLGHKSTQTYTKQKEKKSVHAMNVKNKDIISKFMLLISDDKNFVVGKYDCGKVTKLFWRLRKIFLDQALKILNYSFTRRKFSLTKQCISILAYCFSFRSRVVFS